MTSFSHYRDQLENALKKDIATEHTHRPALKTLLESLDRTITATNEPRRVVCGAPDYVITRDQFIIGYIEAKDVGASLNQVAESEQLKRYRQALANLILTDYLDFQWYTAGALRATASLGSWDGRTLKINRPGVAEVEQLLTDFLNHQVQAIATPSELAERMARLAHIIRDTITEAYVQQEASNLLQNWRLAFAEVLITDLAHDDHIPDFADMVAQTLAYGLFTARVLDSGRSIFTRSSARRLIPKSNPFLRRFFANITDIELDDEPFAPFVDDLVTLLAHTDMESVLANFGRRTRQEDPVVHFYETFLAAYDPRLREARGVYYTPQPVVSYIVRSVDYLLKTRFDAPQGLADSSLISRPNLDPTIQTKAGQPRKTAPTHKILILDPATGTGTFLYTVIDYIRQQFIDQGNAGMWPGYVKHHLLPRIFGFELLMAPYAVAHFKLTMQLEGLDLPAPLRQAWRYEFADDERLGIYLTNALAEAHELTGLPLFTQWVAEETNAANRVKKLVPILVVMGNPPYSVSSVNKGNFIEGLMEGYKTAVKSERNIQPLSDDYIKFIRFAQDRIERTGAGIVALITNHVYLSGLIHRGMRESLLKTFSEIYVIDLHGNATIGETAPDGGKDENLFDIRQGVAIGLFIKTNNGPDLATVKHFELWGEREAKQAYLLANDIRTTDWQMLSPVSEYFFFVPKKFVFKDEYENAWKTNDIFPANSTGIKTHRDRFVIDFELEELKNRVELFKNLDIADAEISRRYHLSSTGSWNLAEARHNLNKQADLDNYFRTCLYRPFDIRYIFYSEALIDRPRTEVMPHLLRDNIAILTMRRIRSGDYQHFFLSKLIVSKDAVSSLDSHNLFPLYLYPPEIQNGQNGMFNTAPWPPDAANGHRVPNLNPVFVADLEQKLGLTFQPTPSAEDPPPADEVTPADILHYIYAIFHSPTYRQRYAEFLKIDFPRVPITSDVALFRSLADLGRELVGLHLLSSPAVNQFITTYPVAGDNHLPQRGGWPKYTPPSDTEPGRIYINKQQYFAGVPAEVWEFQIGGYQVLHKWLKDRRGRPLTYDDLTHYQRIVVALYQTGNLMAQIEATIPGWPLR